MIQLEYLEWDSNFFHKKIYRCVIDQVSDTLLLNKELTKIQGDLCYIISKDDLKIKNKRSFFLADRKVVFMKNKFCHCAEPHFDYEIISCVQYTPQLLELALLSGQYSRFKTDKFLNPWFNKMYKIWLEKSLDKQIASEVFVFKNDNEQLGFVTIKKKAKSAIVGLIAVNETHQGKKIGSSLLKKVEWWCSENDIETLEIATQMDNEKACAFYKKNGYEIKQIEYIYHYYKNADQI